MSNTIIYPYPPLMTLEKTDFRNAWADMVRFCLRDGLTIVANEMNPRFTLTKDVTGVIMLTGDAIKQIINHQVHDQFPTRGEHLKEYCKQFTLEYVWNWLNQDPNTRFEYLYADRLMAYKGINQLKMLKERLETLGINRQNQAITWEVDSDPMRKDPPCLQRIWIRIVGYGKDGTIYVEVHLMWRSRDLFGAWMSNMVAVIEMLNTYVLNDTTTKDNPFKIVKIVDMCNSLHIYEADWDSASLVKPIPVLAR